MPSITWLRVSRFWHHLLGLYWSLRCAHVTQRLWHAGDVLACCTPSASDAAPSSRSRYGAKRAFSKEQGCTQKTHFYISVLWLCVEWFDAGTFYAMWRMRLSTRTQRAEQAQGAVACPPLGKTIRRTPAEFLLAQCPGFSVGTDRGHRQRQLPNNGCPGRQCRRRWFERWRRWRRK
eukprot:7307748-Prymnesium_polylepis.2